MSAVESVWQPDAALDSGPGRRTRRVETRRLLTLLVAAVAAVAALADLLGDARVAGSATSELGWNLAWLSYVAVGAVLAHRRPELAVGTVLVLTGCSVELAGATTVAAEVAHGQGQLGLAAALGWSASLVYRAYVFLVGVVLPLHLPDGRLAERGRPRALLWAGLAAWTVWAAAGLLQPGHLDTVAVPNPLAVPAARPLDALGSAAALVLAVVAVASFGRLSWQWRRATAERRRALAFLALGGTTTLVLFGVATGTSALGLQAPTWLATCAVVLLVAAFPVSVGLAVHRAGLLDVELVLRRTLTYLAMTVVVAAVYVLTVVLVGRATRHDESLAVSLTVTALAAVGLSPLRERAQRQVDRMLYGRRSDPYGVLRDLDTAIGRAHTPAEVLGAVTEVIAHALRLPHVGVVLADEPGRLSRRTSWGPPQPTAHELDLTHHGRRVGTLQVAARSPGERFSTSDERLLREVADHVASAVAAVALAEEAQHSRERLVRALEEDRRRIRRDLHDHLGPVLSGITLQLDAVRRLSASNPEAAALTGTIRDEVSEALVDVRRLVHDLRPPVLDQLGLEDALRHHADLLTGEVRVTVIAGDLPALPAAVEVAAYRIATEALTNTLRHAGATAARVDLRMRGDDLVLTVSDDGRGVDADVTPGVGLASMRERTAELGGSLALESRGGTTIRVELPT